MSYNEAKTLGLIRHKTDIILSNGPWMNWHRMRPFVFTG